MPDDKPEQASLPPSENQNRSQYYQQQAQKILEQYPHEFKQFAAGNEELVDFGDQLLAQSEATGYNLLFKESHLPLASKDKLLFYSNYLSRPEHFGFLLASMEQAGIITENDIRFGVKASKTVYKPSKWEASPDEKFQTMTVTQKDGTQTQMQIDETVETVVIFMPKDDLQAAKIAQFLLYHTDADNPDAITGSWQVPDIRATIALEPILAENHKFKPVTANIYTTPTAQLIAMRQETQFDPPFISTPIEVNTKLAQYLVSAGVAP